MYLGIRSMFFVLSFLMWSQIAEGQQRPNIILIVTDDQGWGDLSMNGNTNLSTPHIDQLAEEGVVFSKFYVQPVCSPTRAEILTGRFHPRSGVYSTSAGGERIDLDEITIADVLKKNGYRTAAFGKWHSGMQAPYHPNARGFDEFYGFASGHWGNYFSPMLEHNGRIVQGKGYLPDDLTDRALEFMRESEEDPFFIYLPYNTPHSPMQVPDEYWDKQVSKPLEMFHRDSAEEDTLFTKAALAMVENIDDNVGRLMKGLKDYEVDEETLVIFLSDNGPNSMRWNGGMKGKKGWTDEGGVRSPLIMRWKNHLLAGGEVGHITSAVDLFPTLLAITGIDHKSSKPLDGFDFLAGDYKGSSRYVFNYWRDLSVRSQDFRLDKDDLLFHMKDDPGQLKDVRLDYPGIYNKLLEAKTIWLEEVVAELPVTDERSFPVGHPEHAFTQLPARDALHSSGVSRSNRWPNSSYLLDWNEEKDSIFWDVEVLATGDFHVEIYYACPPESVGSTMKLSSGTDSISKEITEAHDPPEIGSKHDVYPRMEGPVKRFKPISLGNIRLEEGRQQLLLSLDEVRGSLGPEFRLMMLRRL